MKENQWEYSGEYRSDELDVSYRVKLAGDRLVLARRKIGEQTLVPRYQDGFRCESFAWEFTRDANGKVNGALANDGNIMNLRFRRVP